MADATKVGAYGAGNCRVDNGEENSGPKVDTTRASNCGVGGYRVDDGKEDNRPKVDIVTSTYTS